MVTDRDQNALSDFLTDRAKPDRGSGDSQVLDILRGIEARDDLVARLEEQFDQELMEEAISRVRLRVEPHNWEAFRLTALEGLSGAKASAQLGMAVTSVYKAKSNVQKLLQAEVRYLEGGET